MCTISLVSTHILAFMVKQLNINKQINIKGPVAKEEVELGNNGDGRVGKTIKSQ